MTERHRPVVGNGRLEAMLACQHEPYFPHIPNPGKVEDEDTGAGYLVSECLLCQTVVHSTEEQEDGVFPDAVRKMLLNRLWLNVNPTMIVVREEP